MLQIRQLTLGPMQTNCYLVGCEETLTAAVIDPAWDGRGIVEAAEMDGWEVSMILLTHAHFDHLGGLADVKQLTGAPIYIHPDAAPEISSAPMLAAFFGMRIEAPPEADIMLEDKQTLTVGTVQLEVIHTPGHAAGHVSFYLPQYRVVFDGDTLFQDGIGRTDLPGGDHETLLSAIRERLLTLPDDTRVFPGHGPATTIGYERRSNEFLEGF
jgi:hydroxyacylglutathione hydrolase